MKYSLKSILQLFIACGIYLLLSGCASTKYVHVNEIKERILKSPTAIAISPEEFDKVKSTYNGPKEYCGMGFLGRVVGELLGVVDPVFSKILYDPADSSLFIEGVVYEHSKKPNDYAQIIFGKLPEGKKDTSWARIDIFYNYLIPKDGKFSTAFKLEKDYQLIFANRDTYYEDGEFAGAWVATIEAYDISKLKELYKSGSNK